MQENYSTRRGEDTAPSVGTLHYSESGALSVPQNLGGLSRRRGNLSDKLVRGWRVLLRPADDRAGMPLREFSASETLTPVGTVTHGDAPGEFRYQPMLYAHANLSEYRARRRREESIGRLVLGALTVAVTVSVGIVLFVHPSPKKPTTIAQQAAPQIAAPVVPAAPTLVIYAIQKGDTLGGIAKRHRVKLKALMAANGLGEKSKLKIGQELKIPRPAPAPAALHSGVAAPVGAIAPAAGIAPVVADAPVVANAPVVAAGVQQPAAQAPASQRQAMFAGGPLREPTAAGDRLVASIAGPGAGLPEQAAQAGRRNPVVAQPDPAPPVRRALRSSAPRVYKVRRGDFTEIIAKRNGLRPATLLFANQMHERSVLQPGQELKIPPADGYYHTVRRGETVGKLLKRAGVDEAKFRRLNPEVGRVLRAKQVVFVPGNVPEIEPPARAERAAKRGGRGEAAGERKRNGRGYRGRDERKRASRGFWGDIGRAVSDGFNWPISSRAISSNFGERGHHDWHPGLDIRAGVGTPIRAARDGVVVRSGWEGAYGRMVEIDHGGGVRTRYAHASKLAVRAGERVKAGEVIGNVGTSGRSTGPHLHYEVRVNGRAVNPKKVH